MDIICYPEERDDKGELIKAGDYFSLRRATLLSQPENEKVYSLGDTCCCLLGNKLLVHVCDKWNKRSFKGSKSQGIKRKSGQYFLLSKIVEKVVPKVSNISQMLHTIH